MFNFDKNFLFERLGKVNYNLIITAILIFAFGIVALYSADNGSWLPWAKKQLIYFIMFMPALFVITLININFWFKTSYFLYICSLLSLILVGVIGHKSMGATRWINLGFMRVQPAEIMQICIILALAKYFHNKDLIEIKQNKTLIVPTIIMIIPTILVLKQPSLGTALLLIAITTTIFFCSGVQLWKFMLCLLLIVSTSPIIWKYGIKDYQKQRVLTFLNPTADPLKSGYNITQSKIAIGSGGLNGKGFLNGTQGQLEFLPEKHTDFIFTIIAEEFGFLGVLILVILYLVMFCILIYMVTKNQNNFGRIIIMGVFTNLFFHFFINIGMITGILPIVGMPLPLLSYGGSITSSTLISLGFVLNADINRNVVLKDKNI